MNELNKLKIRKVEKNDLPAVLELYSQLDVNEKILDLISAESIYNRIKLYPDYSLYIAVQEDEAIGTFALLIMDKLVHSGAKSGVVEDVVVGRKWRGQGIGSQMMNFAIEECRKAECYKLMLSSNLKREEAHKFYKGLGFKKHGYSFLIEI